MSRDWPQLKQIYLSTKLCTTTSVLTTDVKIPPAACDSKGRIHTGVLMHQTSAWEPFIGHTANVARAYALTQKTSENIAAACVYHYCTGRRSTPPNRKQIPNAAAFEKTDANYNDILKKAPNVSPFAVPFFHILQLTLPVGRRIHSLAANCVRRTWTTSFGPGRLLQFVCIFGIIIGGGVHTGTFL